VRGVFVVICALAAPVFADAPSEDVSESTFHGHQFGLSARLALGYRALFTAEQSTFCGVFDSTNGKNASVCTGRGPLVLDLEAAYGVARSIEVLVEVRIGLEKDFGSSPGAMDGPHEFHIAPGARFFFSEAKHAKLFFAPMVVFDLTSYPGGNTFDMGVRSLEGVWIDLHRTYGIYFFIGETIELLKYSGNQRWLDGDFEGGFGIQGRYP
jgi:hypothetical protein